MIAQKPFRRTHRENGEQITAPPPFTLLSLIHTSREEHSRIMLQSESKILHSTKILLEIINFPNDNTIERRIIALLENASGEFVKMKQNCEIYKLRSKRSFIWANRSIVIREIVD